MRFSGKVAVVTGGSRDIGKAVSQRLAADGARVIVNYRGDEVAAQETVRAIADAGGDAVAHRADVTRADEVAGLIEAAGERIDILVNLAGGMIARKTLAEMDEAFFDAVMDVNFRSAFLVTKAALAKMGAGGVIINVASQAGRDGGGPGASIYAAAKGAMMSATRGWAKELGARGIRVNAVTPGMIATSFHDTFSKPEGRAATANATALRREGTSEEVADVIAYLASDEASFLTGVNLDINGGLAFS